MSTWTAVIALLFAFSLDLWLGRPASRWHPLLWMRKYLELAGRQIAPHKPMPSPDWLAFSAGALAWYCGATMVVLLTWLLQWGLLFLDAGPAGLLLGAALKPMVSWRFPRLELLKIEAALAQSLEAGRRELGLLVKRDVTQLDEVEVRESAIECLGEHLNVSVVAPVFWFFVAGLPGAVLYRYVNLAGATWGYRGFRDGANWEWAGKWAARADDVLTWLPARITAFLIVAVAWRMPLRELRREAGRMPSPNSGWPTAAMALALGRRLRKPGVCVLNGDGAAPNVGDSGRALRLSGRVVAVLLACTCVALLLAWERPW